MLNAIGDGGGFEQGLGRNASPEDAGPAEPLAFDHGDGKAELSASNGAHISGRSAADENHVKRSHESR